MSMPSKPPAPSRNSAADEPDKPTVGAPHLSRPELAQRLTECLALKSLPRAGWIRVGVEAPETVASHAWGVAWLVLALCPPHVDRGRALAMAVLHDLAEVRIGDITPHDGVDPADKRAREVAALDSLVAGLGHAQELSGLWIDFETGASPEGRFVQACDKLDMALQAQHYARVHGIDPREFVEATMAVLEDEALRALLGEKG